MTEGQSDEVEFAKKLIRDLYYMPFEKTGQKHAQGNITTAVAGTAQDALRDGAWRLYSFR